MKYTNADLFNALFVPGVDKMMRKKIDEKTKLAEAVRDTAADWLIKGMRGTA